MEQLRNQNTEVINPDIYPLLQSNACGSIQAIINQVCFCYHINEKQLREKTHRREIVEARGVAMYIMRKHLPVRQNSFEYVGNVFDKDHATAMHHIRRIEELLQFDKSFKAKMEGILW